jgi:hypothetical protein
MLDTVTVILSGMFFKGSLDGIQDEINCPISSSVDTDLMISPVKKLKHFV